jgi:hypothetical protein
MIVLLKDYKAYKVLFPLSLVLFFPMVMDSTFFKFTNSNITRFVLGISGGIGFSIILIQVYLRWEGKMDRFWRKRGVLAVLLICLLYLASMYNISSAQEKKYVKLRAGTPLMLEVIDTIDSEKYKLGQTVPLIVGRPVTAEDHIVILTHAQVHAKVSKVTKAGGWGGKGEIQMVVESCFAVDGQEIMISATHYTEGESSRGSATAVGVGAGILCLPFALTGFAVKGEEGKIPAGMTIKARVDTDYKIAVLDENELERKQKEAIKQKRETRRKMEEKRLKEEEEKKEKERLEPEEEMM